MYGTSTSSLIYTTVINKYNLYFWICRDLGDKLAEAEAGCGLGSVYQAMCEYSTGLQYHQLDLKIAEEQSNLTAQGRAHGNISLAYESLGNFEQAVKHGEQHLSIAAQMNDKVYMK